jgi:DeoR family suf operon transcriptional repressor
MESQPRNRSSFTAEAPPTREAALAVLMRQGECTAAELAEQLAVSVQVMRRHLRGLEEDQLVEASSSQTGPGRPSNRWRLTVAGHGWFPDGNEAFALGLLKSMSTTLPPETLAVLLHQQAVVKAATYRHHIGEGTLQQRLQRLAELRCREGYVTDFHREAPGTVPPDGPNQTWLISEHHCSVMRIAEAFPVICDQELLLIRQTFPDCEVERVHWRLEAGHACGFRLMPLAEPSPATPTRSQPSC